MAQVGFHTMQTAAYSLNTHRTKGNSDISLILSIIIEAIILYYMYIHTNFFNSSNKNII